MCDFWPTPIFKGQSVCTHKTVYKIRLNSFSGTKCSTGEENNVDVIWTLAESSAKRVEHCTAVTRTMTVLLPVMYVRSGEFCVRSTDAHRKILFILYN